MQRRLPTITNYPGLELAGWEDAPVNGFNGILDSAKREITAYVTAKFEKEVLPRIKAEAGKGAEAAVKPLFIAAASLSAVAIVLSLAALFRASRR